MPASTTCVYRGCGNNSRNKDDLIYHRLSSQSWIDYIGNEGLRNLTLSQLRERRICSAHFLESDYIFVGTMGRKRVKNGATPIDIRVIEQNTIPAVSDDDSSSAPEENIAVKEEPLDTYSDNLSFIEVEALKRELNEVYAQIDDQNTELDCHRIELRQQRIALDKQRIRYRELRLLYRQQQKDIQVLQRKIFRRRTANQRARKIAIDKILQAAGQRLWQTIANSPRLTIKR
ncbi:uncharacterized protein LOC135166821 [Diachasmimorpha longicaudata]|uniref:uncharacterized protein LOC135166821 n=1 Tax=Diachasmimorpha longicaudata TaxID=58733 RepID=UPI0030B8AA58